MINKNFWDYNDQKKYLDEFLELYLNRPIQDNTGGMKSAHMFNAWYVLKKLQPEIIIESGVWKGQGTWFFHQASPTSDIISIDPNPRYRQITIPKSKYITEDFIQINWNQILDTSKAFIFFDDHQSCLPRLKHSHDHGFKYMMFEDNYPYDQGDCYSPKKILSQKRYIIDKDSNRQWFEPSDLDYNLIQTMVDIYQEMPPLFTDTITRWGCSADTYETPMPLLNENDKNKYPIFYQEKLDYTWICYIELQ
jgi:hypothetical protein